MSICRPPTKRPTCRSRDRGKKPFFIKIYGGSPSTAAHFLMRAATRKKKGGDHSYPIGWSILIHKMGKLNNFGGITGNRYGNFEKSKKGSRGLFEKKGLLSNIPKVNKNSGSKQAIRFPIKMVLALFHIPFPSSPLQNPINAATEKKVGNFWSSSPRKKRGEGGRGTRSSTWKFHSSQFKLFFPPPLAHNGRKEEEERIQLPNFFLRENRLLLPLYTRYPRVFWGDERKWTPCYARDWDHHAQKQSVSKMPVKTRKSKNKIEKYNY